MNELLNEYKKRFGEEFPLMLCRDMTDSEITKVIKSCLENDKPYEVDEKADY